VCLPHSTNRDHVHLCSGDWTDFFAETVFGRIQAGPPRWFCGYLDRLWDYSGYSEYLTPTLPATGKEATDWQDVLIVHEEGSNATQNYLIRPEGWKPLGPPHKLHMNHGHVELKVNVEFPDVRVEMDVDDVRLYLHPIRNPVTVVVSSPIVHSRPEADISQLKVRLLENDTRKLLGEDVTDDGGQARIALRSDTIYPVAATI
jgi:hypothetical protein